jgi:hypothetical protein
MNDLNQTTALEELGKYVQSRGFKPEYGDHLLNNPQWRPIIEEIAQRDNVNICEACKRWMMSIPVRM